MRDEELIAKRHVRHHLETAVVEASPSDADRGGEVPRIVAYSDSSGD